MIRARNLYEQAYRHLKREIREGRFPHDAAVLEAELAERLGVSRTPVREALRMLESERLIESVAGGGYRAVRVSPRDVLDAVQARVAIETMAVRLACERAGEAHLAAIDGAVARAREALALGLLGDVMEANEAFHQHVAAAADSPPLAFLLDRIYEYVRARRVLDGVRSQHDAIARMRAFVEEHADIAAALRARDAARACSAMHDHLEGLSEVYVASLALTRDDHAATASPVAGAGA